MSTSNRRYAGVQVRVVPAAVLACLLLAACDHRDPEPAAQGAAPPPAVAYEAHVAAGGVAPPGGTLSNPHQADKAVAAAGANLFTAMNCDGCHGPEGSGAVGPNLGDGRWRYGGADAEVFSSIYYGRPKGMPAFGGAHGGGRRMDTRYLPALARPAGQPAH